jgi:hypothetical protein
MNRIHPDPELKQLSSQRLYSFAFGIGVHRGASGRIPTTVIERPVRLPSLR